MVFSFYSFLGSLFIIVVDELFDLTEWKWSGTSANLFNASSGGTMLKTISFMLNMQFWYEIMFCECRPGLIFLLVAHMSVDGFILIPYCGILQ